VFNGVSNNNKRRRNERSLDFPLVRLAKSKNGRIRVAENSTTGILRYVRRGAKLIFRVERLAAPTVLVAEKKEILRLIASEILLPGRRQREIKKLRAGTVSTFSS
jgi:hypothetical protein